MRYWKDGRDVADIICGLYDYPASDKHPEFTLQMRVNFVDGSGGGGLLRLVGTDGVLRGTFTDDNGRYTLTGLEPASTQLVATSAHHSEISPVNFASPVALSTIPVTGLDYTATLPAPGCSSVPARMTRPLASENRVPAAVTSLTATRASVAAPQ